MPSHGKHMVWFCHECREGPYFYEHTRKCITSNCQHAFCTQCSVEYTDDLGTGSEFGDTQSECSDAATSQAPASSSFMTAAHSCAQAMPTGYASLLSDLTPGGVTIRQQQCFGTETDFLPLTSASLAALDDASPPTLPSGDRVPGARQRGPSTYVWLCCNCHQSSNSYMFDSHCTNCGVKRCSSCIVEDTGL